MQKGTKEDETRMHDSSSNNTFNSPFMLKPTTRAPSGQTVLVTFEIMVETVFWVIFFFYLQKIRTKQNTFTAVVTCLHAHYEILYLTCRIVK